MVPIKLRHIAIVNSEMLNLIECKQKSIWIPAVEPFQQTYFVEWLSQRLDLFNIFFSLLTLLFSYCCCVTPIFQNSCSLVFIIYIHTPSVHMNTGS